MSRPVAVVTGTSSGIGAAITDTLLENGWAVCGISRRPVTRDSAYYSHYTADLNDTKQIEQTIATIRERHLSGGIQALINNAGVGHFAPHEELSLSQLHELTTVNLLAPLTLSKLLLRDLKQSKGSIINMSSIVGINGNAGQGSYAASKAGIIGFTKSIAIELGSRNVRVNAIAPGFIETDMTHYLKEGEAGQALLSKIPMGRFGSAEEIGNTTLYLASDLSSYVTGQVISVCGGLNT